MIDNQMFHIYDKETQRPVKVCMTVDELEQMLAEKSVDFTRWEVEPCYTDLSSEDPSYWMSTNTQIWGLDGFPNFMYDKYMNKCYGL